MTIVVHDIVLQGVVAVVFVFVVVVDFAVHHNGIDNTLDVLHEDLLLIQTCYNIVVVVIVVAVVTAAVDKVIVDIFSRRMTQR